jgi:hypothetical protein
MSRLSAARGMLASKRNARTISGRLRIGTPYVSVAI